MKPIKLSKRRSSTYDLHNREIRAYDDESFADELANLADSLASGGTIFTDTVNVGRIEFHTTVKSPIIIEADSSGAGAKLSGSGSFELGVRYNYKQQSPGPIIPPAATKSPGGIGTYSAIQDETRR